MQLSKRLSAVAEFVTPGGCLVDVGTDHGYVPIALLEQQKISSAIAMDVNRGPLERAREHIAQYNMGDYIETRLSDGLHALRAGEGDSLLIAGMGGGLTVRILSEGEPLLSGFRELILEPQSDIDRVRAWPVQCWGTDFAAPVRDPSGAEVPGGAWLSDHGRGHSAGGWKILSDSAGSARGKGESEGGGAFLWTAPSGKGKSGAEGIPSETAGAEPDADPPAFGSLQ